MIEIIYPKYTNNISNCRTETVFFNCCERTKITTNIYTIKEFLDSFLYQKTTSYMMIVVRHVEITLFTLFLGIVKKK